MREVIASFHFALLAKLIYATVRFRATKAMLRSLKCPFAAECIDSKGYRLMHQLNKQKIGSVNSFVYFSNSGIYTPIMHTMQFYQNCCFDQCMVVKENSERKQPLTASMHTVAIGVCLSLF